MGAGGTAPPLPALAGAASRHLLGPHTYLRPQVRARPSGGGGAPGPHLRGRPGGREGRVTQALRDRLTSVSARLPAADFQPPPRRFQERP